MRLFASAVIAGMYFFQVQGQRIVAFEDGSSDPYNYVFCSTSYQGAAVFGGMFSPSTGVPFNKLVAFQPGTPPYSLPGLPFQSYQSRINDLIAWNNALLAAGRNPNVVTAWNGATWTQLGASFDKSILTLALHGDTVFAGGQCNMYGGDTVLHVVKWNGQDWQQVGPGLNGQVNALASYNGQLYAGGMFTTSGDGADTLLHIAAWSGENWVPVLGGLNGTVMDMVTTPDGLLIAGQFNATTSGSPLRQCTMFNGSSFAYFDVDIDGADATVYNSANYGYGVSDDELSFCLSAPLTQRTGTNELRLLTDVGSLTFGSGTILRRNGDIEVDIGEVVPGYMVHDLVVSGMTAPIISSSRTFFGGVYPGGIFVPDRAGQVIIDNMDLAVVGTSNGSIFSTYSDPSFGFAAGPWSNDTSLSHQAVHNRTRTIDQGGIWAHNSSWQLSSYDVPEELASWPANGDPLKGESQILSSFEDIDGDGDYVPELGDFPRLKGDVMDLVLLNDRYPNPQVPAVGVEHIQRVFGYRNNSDTLRNTLFMNLTFINRSTRTYDTLLIGYVAHWPLGNGDCYMGCDTLQNLAYVYHSDSVDLGGFEAHPPALGMIALNAEMHAFLPWQMNIAQPTHAAAYYRSFRGIRNSGAFIHATCNGQPPGPVTRYFFPGDPLGADSLTAHDCGYSPWYSSFVISYGPFLDFAPGDTVCLDLALIFARDTLGDHLASLARLFENSTSLRYWYDHSGLSCTQDVALSAPSHAHPPKQVLSLAPNPTAERTVLDLGSFGGGQLQILTTMGQVVHSMAFTTTSRLELDVHNLPNGTYIVQVLGKDGARCSRLVVLH
ncbi:MAG: T9SS type A sorting domain-containing protein [Flavobacteriales bacterium]|nr:T9SS type A sorting domain-containing protein [Flavobacteriales bacterium]